MRLSKYFLIVYLAVITFILIISLLRSGTLHDRMRTFVDFLFIAGGVTMALGALIYVGKGRPGFQEWYAHSAGRGDQVEIFLEYRKTQRRHGMLMIIFGLALIGLSMAIGTFYL